MFGFGIYDLVAVVRGKACRFFLPCVRDTNFGNTCNPALGCWECVNSAGRKRSCSQNRDLQFLQAHLAGGAGVLQSWSWVCGLEAAAGGGSSPGDSVACCSVCNESPVPSSCSRMCLQ